MPNKATKQGTKISVCATAQNNDLTQSAFSLLTWVQVGSVGSIGDFGPDAKINSYMTLDEVVVQKQKGSANAGSPNLEVASIPTDPGQIILRTFGDPLYLDNMAIKIERNDGEPGKTNTIFYSRGIVSGPVLKGGSGDDFEVEVFTIELNQLPIRVNPV